MTRGRVRMLARDLFGQALLEALGRPWRTALTVTGTVLGVGMFVATLGITDTTRAQVNQHFNTLVSTEVEVQDAHPDDGVFALTPAGERRALRLNGVVAAGLFGRLPRDPPIAKLSDAAADSSAADAGAPPLLFADTGALGVVGPRLVAGRLFDTTQLERSARVALVGAGAARDLGLDPHTVPAAVYIAGSRFVVEGVIGAARRHSEVLSSVVIPSTTAVSLFGDGARDRAGMIVATRFGYANAVGAALAATISPVDPGRVTVLTPPDPAGLRGQVTSDLSGLFVLLAGVGLIVGMVGIANTTLVSVLERVREIGLRRALGARRGQIAAQFMLESLTFGTLGGVLGACLGFVAVSVVAVAKGWTPVVPLWLPLAAPLLGTVAGLVAGAYPALRAARVDPVAALAK